MVPRIKQNSKWGFVCGRISVLEARLVSMDFYATLLAQEHLDDLIPHLQDTFLREYLGPGSPWEDFSALTDRCFFELALSLREDCPDPTPVDLFLLNGDYMNLKNALVGSTSFPFRTIWLSSEKLSAIAGGDNNQLPEIVQEAGVASLRESTDTAALDAALDGVYLRHLLKLAQGFGNPTIEECVKERVLSRAVGVVWRAVRLQAGVRNHQQYFLPLEDFTPVLSDLMASPDVRAWSGILSGPVGDLFEKALEFPEDEQVSQFELMCANRLTCSARDGIYQTAGPERVFSFLVALYAEMQNVKLVVCGRLNRVDLDLLRRRLRVCYG